MPLHYTFLSLPKSLIEELKKRGTEHVVVVLLILGVVVYVL
jgi:hypothetical protein